MSKPSYDELSKKLKAAEKELKARRTMGECGHGRLQTLIIEAQEKVDSLEAENAKLKAQLWVAKDSALRTYDGLAQKADKADSLEAQLAAAIAALNEIAAEFGTDFCDGNTMIAHEALAKIKEMAEGKE